MIRPSRYYPNPETAADNAFQQNANCDADAVGQGVRDVVGRRVERLGDECRANDIPFFLEFVGYEEGIDEKGLDFAKKKPQMRNSDIR